MGGARVKNLVMLNAKIEARLIDTEGLHKSMFVGANVSESWSVEASLVLSFKIGSIPFIYHGLSIGGDSKGLSF